MFREFSSQQSLFKGLSGLQGWPPFCAWISIVLDWHLWLQSDHSENLQSTKKWKIGRYITLKWVSYQQWPHQQRCWKILTWTLNVLAISCHCTWAGTSTSISFFCYLRSRLKLGSTSTGFWARGEAAPIGPFTIYWKYIIQYQIYKSFLTASWSLFNDQCLNLQYVLWMILE